MGAKGLAVEVLPEALGVVSVCDAERTIARVDPARPQRRKSRAVASAAVG
jgi:hypothetical protein